MIFPVRKSVPVESGGRELFIHHEFNVDPGINKLGSCSSSWVSSVVWRWPWCDVCGRALDKAALTTVYWNAVSERLLDFALLG